MRRARVGIAAQTSLTQIPTLVLADGTVLTESAAITLYLADVTGLDSLVPRRGDATRTAFLRWLVFLVANVYPTYTYADEPSRFVAGEDAQRSFKASVSAYREKLYRVLEGAAGSPCFLGERFSALDVYVCVMSRWRPGRAWFGSERAEARRHSGANRADASARGRLAP